MENEYDENYASDRTPDMNEAANVTPLPEKSKKTYEMAYKTFMEWRSKKNITSFSENNIFPYFVELAEKYKSSSLWTIYSMLRSTLNIHHNVNIESYPNIRSFLKRQSVGYKAKKAAVFTSDEISKFIDEAPDDKYLATKVSLIMAVMGRCRATELYLMKLDHIHDHNTAFIVDIPAAKRRFSISGIFYDIVKKYMNLRPSNAPTNKFFLQFLKGKCTTQIIGINKFGSFGKQIATFLKLPHPETYTGHCLRRSSATILRGGGVNTLDLKLHAGWKSPCVAEGFIESTQRMDCPDFVSFRADETGNFLDLKSLQENHNYESVDSESNDADIKTEIDIMHSPPLVSEGSRPSSSEMKVNNDSDANVPTDETSEPFQNSSHSKIQYHFGKQEDEFDIIGRNMANKLRSLSKEKAILAEKLMMDVIFAAQMGTLNSRSMLVLKYEDS